MSQRPRPRVLVVAGLFGGARSNAHIRVLREFGCDVETIDSTPYMKRGGRLSTWLRFRLLAGREIGAFNDAVLETAKTFKPHLLWAEKPIAMRSQTLMRLRDLGVVLGCLTYDNPFGDRRERLWRLFKPSIPLYDLHVVPRESSVGDFTRAGARAVMRCYFAYDPAHEFPPPDGWGDDDRPIDVAFTGTPYDDRAAKLTSLWRDHGIKVNIRGDLWDRVLDREALRTLWHGGAVFGDAYRERFWQARISLAFVTHENHDDTAHRCFEITASQGFLLSERTDRLRACFAEGEEAVYFSDMAECAEMIRRYLPDTAERERIARNGRARAVAGGYSMPDQFARVFRRLCADHESLPMPDNLPPETAA